MFRGVLGSRASARKGELFAQGAEPDRVPLEREARAHPHQAPRRVALALTIVAELGHIEILAHELHQPGLRQEVDRVVEHIEDVLVTELPDRRPELVPIKLMIELVARWSISISFFTGMSSPGAVASLPCGWPSSPAGTAPVPRSIAPRQAAPCRSA
jgi:hypothetical protein